ncbi:MAG TPA: TIM44-like domain-containing protein, partial [Solirubrobacteraceae bacterium]|nr:TIM44-like domain-containing protein [Solirubrobacteraceae bacterium]
MTPRRRRLALFILAALAVALVVAPGALAAAGGGSSGFSGGGGEGGGGGGGGSGFALFILIRLLIDIAILGHGLGLLFLIALGLLWLFVTRGLPKLQAWWAERAAQRSGSRRKTSERERRVELAAAEAADEDPDFAPDHVRAAAATLFRDIEKAWDTGDRFAMRALVSPDLLVEWERRLDDFEDRGWRNRVEPIGEPSVEYVGLKRTGDADTDHVVVKIDARVKDYVVDRSGRRL